jgi:hypothetical protein
MTANYEAPNYVIFLSDKNLEQRKYNTEITALDLLKLNSDLGKILNQKALNGSSIVKVRVTGR